MAYTKIPTHEQRKRGPKVTEAGKVYRVYIKPSVNDLIVSKYGSLTLALKHLNELELKKDKRKVK